MMILACERSTRLDQLHRDIGVTKAELRAPLRPLCDRGFVAAGLDDAAITRDGERAVAALWAVQERVEEDLYSGFTPAERDQFARPAAPRARQRRAHCEVSRPLAARARAQLADGRTLRS